jgi:hypothetical protein
VFTFRKSRVSVRRDFGIARALGRFTLAAAIAKERFDE